jgi:hypothetical protein
MKLSSAKNKESMDWICHFFQLMSWKRKPGNRKHSHEQDMAKGIARMQSSRRRSEERGARSAAGPHEL